MSYILEALNKSQRERELGKIPKLHTEPFFVPEKQTSKPLIVALITAIIVALSALGLAAYLFFITPAEPPAKTLNTPSGSPSSAHEIKRPSDKTIPQPAIIPVQAIQPPTSPKPDSSPSSETTQPNPTPAATPAPVETAPASISPPEAPAIAEVKPPTLPTPVAADRKSEPLGIFTQQIKREMIHSAPPMDHPQPIEQQYPDIHELPVAFRHTLPPLKILLYYYTEEPQARFVILDSQKLHEGEQHDKSGIQVVEIRKKGMILKFHDQIFFKHR